MRNRLHWVVLLGVVLVLVFLILGHDSDDPGSSELG